jgi:pimeloyl-ACP methyl ester carboxylesterase
VVRRGYVDVAHGQLHYRETGERNKPTLLLLHQSPSSSAMYVTMMEQLADRFYLLAPDTPGFGNSDPVAVDVADLQISDYARSIHQFLMAMDGSPCYIFGHHTGAAVAVQLEHDFPGSALAMALSGPTLLTAGQQESLPQSASPFPVKEGGDHLRSMWQRIREKDPGAPLALAQREVLSAFACGESYQGSYRAVCRQDFSGQLEGIDCPVLVFAGDEDPLYGAVDPTVERLSSGMRADLMGGERTYVCERQVALVAALLAEFFEAKGKK